MIAKRVWSAPMAEQNNLYSVYGFYDECKRRTNIKTWKTFIDVFNTLPIASIVASKIFCVHGGLSPSLTSMDDIRRIQRPTGMSSSSRRLPFLGANHIAEFRRARLRFVERSGLVGSE